MSYLDAQTGQPADAWGNSFAQLLLVACLKLQFKQIYQQKPCKTFCADTKLAYSAHRTNVPRSVCLTLTDPGFNTVFIPLCVVIRSLSSCATPRKSFSRARRSQSA